MSDFPKNESFKTILNDYRYPHPKTDKPLDGARYPATLQWKVKSSSTTLVISDGVYVEGKGYLKKEVDLDPYQRNMVLGLLKDAALNKEFTNAQLTIAKKMFFKENGVNKLGDKPTTIATITILKDPEGIICLAFKRSDFKAMIKFRGPNDSQLARYDKLTGEYKQADDFLSAKYTLAYVKFVSEYLTQMEIQQYKAPEKKGGNNNGNKGNYSNNNNNASSSGGDFEDFEDF